MCGGDMKESVKKLVEDNNIKYISLNLFDTAVLTPFAESMDLWGLLNREYEMYYRSNVDFSSLRREAETLAAAKCGKSRADCQQITLAEIYGCLSEIYNIAESILCELKDREMDWILRCASARRYIFDIYEYACSLGKKIVFISDTVYEYSFIVKLLKKTGYNIYDRLLLSSKERKTKRTGDLYRILIEITGAEPEEILHIGSDRLCDRSIPVALGIQTCWVPSPLHNFEDADGCSGIRERSTLGKYAAGIMADFHITRETAGFRMMLTVVANQLYDTPSIDYEEHEQFVDSPQYIGYYYVGMHLLGLVSWISDCVKHKYEKIYFTARDGYLIKKAYDVCRLFDVELPESRYIYVSRKALLPGMLISRQDFMDLPIVWSCYSPQKCLELLDFCVDDTVDWEGILSSHDIDCEEIFREESDYRRFIGLFLNYIYSDKAHKKAISKCREYLSDLGANDVVFDMGYSGRIQKAICDILQKSIDVLFIFSDNVRSNGMARSGGFHIKTFYDFIPVAPGVFREYLLSECAPSCIGYDRGAEGCIPIFDQARDEKGQKIIKQIQEAAMEFVEDYFQLFGTVLDFIPFKPQEVSFPFEAFIRKPSKGNTIFSQCYFEDKVYGASEATNMQEFLEKYYREYELRNRGYLSFEKQALLYCDHPELFRKIVLFGTGKIGINILDKYPWLPVEFLLDNAAEKRGMILRGKEIRSPSQIDYWSRFFVIITVRDKVEIEDQLRELGLSEHIDFVYFEDFFDGR